MSDDHRRFRHLLGSYALGVTDQAERIAVEAHLDGCESCREELAELDRAARRLALVAPGRLTDRPSVPPDLAHRLFDRIAAERRRQRWRQFALAAGAAAAIVVLALVFRPDPPGEPQPPPGRSVEFAVVPEGVTASAELRDWGWGTQMYLEIDGLPKDQRLAVWLERPDGSRISAGTFVTTGDTLTMALGAGTPADEAVALGISTPDGATLLHAPL